MEPGAGPEKEEVGMEPAAGDTSIEALPDEVLEHILAQLSPYADLESCALTCSRWSACCRRVRSSGQQHFLGRLGQAGLVWSRLAQPGAGGGAVSKRYSHCAVYCPARGSMFVFGGCTSTSSTFNDLWELSLSLRTWARPLSVGAYPSPKACATLVLHNNCLVLFGGWTHPSLYPLHQSWKLFSELHIYHLQESRWELVGPEEGGRPPAMAGHSATVHGDTMVVFGGLHKQPSEGHYTSSNDVWTFDLASQRWQLQVTGGDPRPLPRYGQSQVVAGPHHILLLGGCGGPNTEYADIWLLDMTVQPWTWVEMEVRGEEHRAKDIWSHPACRVGDLVVVLGKGRREEPVPVPAGQAKQPVQARRGPLRRAAVPAPHRRHDFSSSDSDLELAVEPLPPRAASYRTTLSVNIGPPPGPSPPPPSALPPSNPANAPNALIPVKVTPAHAKAFGPGANTGNQDPSLASSRAGHQPPGPGAPGNPEERRQVQGGGRSNRQKMLENRQRQLASLQRMEERIRSQGPGPAAGPSQGHSAPAACPHHRLAPHLLDVSQAVAGHWVRWLPLPLGTAGPAAPQESILYSLVLGRTELIMFGGLQKEAAGGSAPGRQPQPNAETVSNCLHFLNPPPQSI